MFVQGKRKNDSVEWVGVRVRVNVMGGGGKGWGKGSGKHSFYISSRKIISLLHSPLATLTHMVLSKTFLHIPHIHIYCFVHCLRENKYWQIISISH